MSVIREHLKNGARLALDNANALFEMAQLSKQKGENGISRSLFILASEEAVKSTIILDQSANPSIEIEDWDKLFRDHSVKHKHIKNAMLFVGQLVKEFFEIPNIMPIVQMIELLPDDAVLATGKVSKHMLKMIRWNIWQIENPFSFPEAVKWWDGANEEKNKGFYLDKSDEGWHNPRCYTSADTEVAEKHSKLIITMADMYMDTLFSSTFEEKYKDRLFPKDNTDRNKNSGQS